MYSDVKSLLQLKNVKALKILHSVKGMKRPRIGPSEFFIQRFMGRIKVQPFDPKAPHGAGDALEQGAADAAAPVCGRNIDIAQPRIEIGPDKQILHGDVIDSGEQAAVVGRIRLRDPVFAGCVQQVCADLLRRISSGFAPPGLHPARYQIQLCRRIRSQLPNFHKTRSFPCMDIIARPPLPG